MVRGFRLIAATVLPAMMLMLGSSQADNEAGRQAPSELSFFGGGWDANGPALSGAVAPDGAGAAPNADEAVVNAPQRGGWDGNGPDASGAVAPADVELDLDRLMAEAVTPPPYSPQD